MILYDLLHPVSLNFCALLDLKFWKLCCSCAVYDMRRLDMNVILSGVITVEDIDIITEIDTVYILQQYG
jgi:hypothetical protein